MSFYLTFGVAVALLAMVSLSRIRRRPSALEAERAIAAAQEAERARAQHWLFEVHLPFVRKHADYFSRDMHRKSITEKQEWKLRGLRDEHGLDIDTHCLTRLEASSVIGMYEDPSFQDLYIAFRYEIEGVEEMSQSEVRHAIAKAKLAHDEEEIRRQSLKGWDAPQSGRQDEGPEIA